MIRLPHFTLAELLHDRGGAVLYRGVRDADGSPVTIKILAGPDLGNGVEARIRHEYRILQTIDAPGVVRALALLRWEGGLALVLEDAPGRPLDAILRDGPLDLAHALAIGAGITRALVAVHRAGVVHRDIKPANVIVDMAAGAVKLIDFGISVRRSAPARPEALEGSLAYIAPEQTGRMEGRGFDARSDLYALGVTLYEMLAGNLPFQETDPVTLVHAHLARTPAPLSHTNAQIPDVVSDVVARLLCKAPEDRYQSAAGLLFDLEACLSDLRDGTPIRGFVPGRRDVPVDLLPPGELFGRERERAAMLAAYERAALGGAEIVVLEGPPGVGKSALVQSFGEEVARRGGRLGGGKCEQTGRAAPHAAVVQALGELFRAVGDGDPASRAHLGRELEAALGTNAGVLVDLVPAAEPLLHARAPRGPDLGAAETKHRLALALERTLATLARHHPLALFLDDVQWADPASIELVQSLLSGGRARRLLVVLAMREGEAERVSDMLAELERAGVPRCELAIEPLDREGTLALVADVLRLPPARVQEVSDGIFARTGGNPLFAMTLLRSLHEAGALAIDPVRGAIEADFARAAFTDDAMDVASLLGRQLGRLSAPTQRALLFAASLGHSFDPGTLARASGMPEDDIASALDEAAREGFLYPSGAAGAGVLRFTHDRVQQAALALGEERERRAIELAAGRRLRARAGASPRDEDLFVAVELLNAAAALIDDPEERASLARDDLMAGRRARTRAAFAAARRYFEAGVGMLDEALWERDRAMAFALCAELCECEVSIGEPLAAEARLTELERRAKGPLERVRLAAVRIEIFVRDGKNAEAAAVGAEALGAVGIDLPAAEEERRAALDQAMATEMAALHARAPSLRLEAPEMTDPEALASERLLMAMALPAYFSSPSLYGLVTSALVDLFARHGHSDISAMGYAHYGAFLMGLEGRSADAYTFGKLAVALVEKRKNHALACRVVETVGGNIAFLHEPLREVLARFPGALRAGIEAGDLLHANYVCGHIVPMRIAIGDDLAEVEAQMAELVAIVDRSGDVFGMAVMRVLWRTLWDLLGRPEDRRPLEGNFGEAVIDDLASKDDFSTLAGFRRTQRLIVHVVHGAWAEALAEAEAAEAKGPYAPGQFFATELAFFAALARLRTAPRGPLAVHRDNLRTWANLCPATYRAKHLLVEAEAMRVRGEEFEAMRLYDEAIAAAQEHDMVRDEAIASELCAEFHAAHGRAKVARSYSTDALSAYRRWGAAGKVRVIEGRLSGRMGARPEGPPLGDITATASANASALLDATAAIRAAQAIATEVVLSRVVEQLLRILAAVAGAERAIMLVEREDGFRVAGRLGPGGIEAGCGEPLDAAPDLAASVVRHVARSGEPVVLSDAARADYFAADPYVLRSRPRSLLCMAVAHAGRRAGIVYLENNAARGAFARDRLEPLGVLVAQAAIAMENAQLYEQLEATTAELRRANARLEGDVAQRTAELRRELVAREQAEASRAELSEEIIRVQRERLAELSAPLLPIADGVVLVPLIGTMDAARAAEVLQTALGGASAFGARAVILDVTGMKGAGSGIAEALVTTARALALLGAEAVITGIRPDVARALVEGGAELSGLTTRSTLQSGMAYALRRAGTRAR